MIMAILIKEKHVTEVMAYMFRGPVHCHHVVTWCAGRQGAGDFAGRCPMSWLISNIEWFETLGNILSVHETSKPTSTVTHLLQQDDNKTTPPYSGSPCEVLGANYIETTTVLKGVLMPCT